jgi:hypothetical protein
LDLLFSLPGLAASSKEARKADRDGLVSILKSLRASLDVLTSDSGRAEVGKSQFSNAASDLFCHVRVSAANLHGRLDRLSAQVETVLGALQRGTVNVREVNSLLGALNTEIKSLQAGGT